MGMRELPPQPAKPVMPTYTMPSVALPVSEGGPGPDDSVVARDDHFEGTFTSRGTVVVMGSLQGRVEAVRVRIEDGARVDADVVVDEAIIAGAFTGNLTCRQRLEAHASGRINGRIETYRLMLHEGASVEGEMHMLTEAPKDASETIRGTAPVRGEGESGGAKVKPAPVEPPSVASPAVASPAVASPAAASPAAASPAAAPSPAATRLAPSVKPSSGAAAPSAASPASSPAKAGVPAAAPSPGAVTAAEVTAAMRRGSVAETLRTETLRIAPRVGTSSSRPRTPAPSSSGGGRTRNGSGSTTGF
jgi:cytoskeletal protein CcmA (bactofilin family)